MSTLPEHADVTDESQAAAAGSDESVASEPDAAPSRSKAAVTELKAAVAARKARVGEPAARSQVRDLTRWGIPFHYVPPVIVAVIGVAMLVIGGTVGAFGGWVLASALPIAIGAFLASPWFALAPAVVWIGWIIFVSTQPENADLSNTPTLLGLTLAAIGAGSTVVAQRAVFPATAPGAWEASIGRLVPPLDDGEPVEFDDHTDDHTVDLAVAEPIEATDEELEAADAARAVAHAAARDDATIASVPLGDEAKALAEQAAEEQLKTKSNAEAEKAKADEKKPKTTKAKTTKADAQKPKTQKATKASATKKPKAKTPKAKAAAQKPAVVPPPRKVDLEKAKSTDDETGSADVVGSEAAEDKAGGSNAAADARTSDSVAKKGAEPKASDEPEPTPITELPLDADPSELDEGGHVTEFTAISEADLMDLDADDDSTDDDQTPAGSDASPPAATRASQHRSGAGR